MDRARKLEYPSLRSKLIACIRVRERRLQFGGAGLVATDKQNFGLQRSLVANQSEPATVYRPLARYRFWASHHEDSRGINECGPHLFPPARLEVQSNTVLRPHLSLFT